MLSPSFGTKLLTLRSVLRQIGEGSRAKLPAIVADLRKVDDPGDARWLVSVEPDLWCRVGTDVTPATHIEGGGHQVQGSPLSELGN